MRWMARGAVVAVAVALAGCIEVSARTDVNPDGSITSHTEIGVAKAFVDEFAKMQPPPKGQTKAGKKAKVDQQTFASMCQGGFNALMQEEMAKSKGKSTKGKPATPSVELPKMTGVVSTRGEYAVCTLTETMTDPVTQYAAAMQKSGLSPTMANLELLPGGNGYRFGGTLRLADLMAVDKTLSAEDRAGMAMMAGMIPREMTFSMTTSGMRVENTNGAISADGKSVTWKLPVHKIFDMRPEAEPITLTADVYFK